MKLKINKACDLGSISVLPPRRTGGSGGAGGAAGSQPRSQPMSQQSLAAFSQAAGGSGGGSSLLHSQSQLSQGSLDESLLSLHLASPTRDQRFGLHDDSSKKMPSVPVSSAPCVREESQLQLAKTSSNPVHRWNPSLPDSRCSVLTGQVPTEDVELKLRHLASSVHKMGLVLDSVQNDAMQLNRAMKEASLDSGSIQQKIVVLDNSMQKILKEQYDLKALVESNTKSIADQQSVLNSRSNKLDEVSSTLSVWPKQIETDLRRLQSDIEGVARAIRSLNSRLDAIQMPTDQGGTASGRPLMNQLPVPNERPQVNQTPLATRVSQTPIATVVNQTPAKNGRHMVSQTLAANGQAMMSQIPAPNGRSVVSQKPTADGRPQVNQIPVASGRPHTNKIPALEVHPAPPACPAKGAYPKFKVEARKAKVLLPQKLTGSRTRVTPKEEEVPVSTKAATRTRVAAKKAPPVMIIIDSDDESEGRVSCVIVKPSESGDKERQLMKEAAEESMQILRRARKRKRRQMQAIVPAV